MQGSGHRFWDTADIGMIERQSSECVAQREPEAVALEVRPRLRKNEP